MTGWVQLQERLRSPRIFRKEIADRSAGLVSGDWVAVRSKDDHHIGFGLWHPKSLIAVRLVRRGDEFPDDEWLLDRARMAALRRLQDPTVPDDLCRVIHAEADDFPGLVVDRYGDTLCAEAYTSSVEKIWDLIVPQLHETLGTQRHRLVMDTFSARAEGEPTFEKRSSGFPNQLKVEEHGIRWELDLQSGHKTGFFIDQRENRLRLQQEVKQLKAQGRTVRVLDVCTYTGGFALNAATGGADEVLAIDLDEKAIVQAKRNANLNQHRQVQFRHADAFPFLRQLAANGKQFDIVVVDPPKFIPSRKAFEEGQAKYHDINKLAIPLIAPGGLMLTCSCSGLLRSLDFQETIRRSARLRPLQILREAGAGPDHPYRLSFPEGHYLKAFWMRAD
jgi:23S rRNA (cytosine1962-C5)-methyltransferase